MTNLKQYITKFDESEIETKIEPTCHLAMIHKHEKAVKILEAVRTLMQKEAREIDSVEGFPGTFPRLRRKSIHNIDIYRRAINRLMSRYNKVVNG